jgi:transcriptional regulator with XRE-family HTH domain
MSSDNNQNIRLKEVRNYFGLNQSDFSKSINIDQAYLSQLENGKVRIGSKILLSLSEKYQISIDWLFTGKGSMFIQFEDDKALRAIEKILVDLKDQGFNINVS